MCYPLGFWCLFHFFASIYLGDYGEITMNDRGELVVNLQTATWIKNVREKEGGIPNIQFINRYEGGKHPFIGNIPKHLDQSWHPPPTMLNLGFSHDGTWVLAPKERGDKTGPYYKNHNIARMETYINEEGEKRRQ